jgi:hypothetical protein
VSSISRMESCFSPCPVCTPTAGAILNKFRCVLNEIILFGGCPLFRHHLNCSSAVLPSSVHRLSGRATRRLLAQEISHSWATTTPQSCRPSFRSGELYDRRLAIVREVSRSRICLLVASAPGVDASLCYFSSPLLY